MLAGAGLREGMVGRSHDGVMLAVCSLYSSVCLKYYRRAQALVAVRALTGAEQADVLHPCWQPPLRHSYTPGGSSHSVMVSCSMTSPRSSLRVAADTAEEDGGCRAPAHDMRSKRTVSALTGKPACQLMSNPTPAAGTTSWLLQHTRCRPACNSTCYLPACKPTAA